MKALKAITDDLDPERNGFNTAISRMSEFINAMYKYLLIRQEAGNIYSDEDKQVLKHVLFNFLKTLAPFAPHLAEELWMTNVLKKSSLTAQDLASDSVHVQAWAKFEKAFTETNSVNLVLQIKGKKIDVVEVAKDLAKEEAEQLAKDNEKMKKRLEGLEIKKIIVVPNKLVNIVAI